MGKQEQDNDSREGVKKQEERKWYSLIDKIWAKPNLEDAFKEVKRNRGAAGIDQMTVKAFESKLEHHLEVLQQTLRSKTYRPKPVRRVYIPKADGTQRPLGIPTVGDRVVQAAAKRILEPIFEAKFMDCSYGFRPGRSAHMALEKIRQDLENGFRYVIDADLKSYFDTIPHEMLVGIVKETVVDGSVLELIGKFLKAGVLEGGSFHINGQGTPQGGVISPLLANIYLHPLDQVMTERGHRLTRYADDFVICCKTQKGAERVLKSVTGILEREMGLRIHPEKTRIVNSKRESFVFLGHEFKPGKRMTPSARAMTKFKERVKEITKRNRTVDVQRLVKKELNPYLRGWGRYYGTGDVRNRFRDLDAWIRRRLRAVQLRSWKKVRKLHRAMRKRGWDNKELPGLRMTAWRSSHSTYAQYAMPNSWFEEIGLSSLLAIYKELHPQRG
ncbi:group II intron reverse transcriptase/maturase [Paenibacillus sp. LMG 31461]|uniref:Group II intron reverse transcriptase/maturase n=1 Tax=Paenibacillus plantarum TaxID=2654975 RepID=A0ABX1X1Z0_9BACL|nr:group II intron reverse transcriptase/maturase [Paenibacillus plantarum]NOU62429.1 group II intron reverse transcriptase/maturase [Paenibacillus plantarum]